MERRLEEVRASPTPGSRRRHVTIKDVDSTPGGTERVLRSATYRYKTTPPGESKEERKSRQRVHRDAKARAEIHLDPEAHEAANAKRRKPMRSSSQAPPLVETAGAAPASRRSTAGTEQPEAAKDAVTERDWYILKAFKRGEHPAAVLEGLLMAELFEESDEPWDALRVKSRHDFVCKCVRNTARLVGAPDSPTAAIRSMAELASLVSP
jgi:hypothetical protein